MRWEEFEVAEPDLAEKAVSRLEAHPHHVIATLKEDGAPRVSGVNVEVFGGELWIGCMPNSRKAADLRRDGRCAIHSAPLDEALADPDVRIEARAIELDRQLVAGWLTQLAAMKGTAVPDEAEVFHLDVKRVSVVTVAGSDLVVDTWDFATGRRIIRRQ